MAESAVDRQEPASPRFLPAAVRRWLARVPHWCRVVMDRDIASFLGMLPLRSLDAVEISGRRQQGSGFRSWCSLSYPQFDLCKPVDVPATGDVVFCEQVLEHVADPLAAARTLRALTRPGGHLVVSTPFLIRIHREPADYWRFSADGLRQLLETAGLEVIRIRSWGNLRCLIANRFFWFPYIPFLCSLSQAEDLPLVVWAIARRPET